MESTRDDPAGEHESRHRRERVAIWTFLTGNAVSLTGNAMTIVALPWFVLETTGSAGRTGLTGMMAALPALIAGVLGGVLVDRFGGRQMSVVSDIISGISVAAIPLLHFTIGLQFWQLLVLVFVGAALDIPGVTARRTLLPELAQRAQIRPEAMNSSFETMQSIAFIVGPAVAGVLIGWIGAVSLLWVTAASFGFSALMVGLFSPSGKHGTSTKANLALEGFVSEVREGLRFLRTDSLLLWLAIGLALVNFLLTPFWSVVMPVEIEQHYGSASLFGLLLTMFGIGSLAGGMVYGLYGHHMRHMRRAVYLAGFVAFTVLTWILVPQVPYAVLMAAVLVTGVMTGPINPMLVTVRFERIPPELRGRVFATFSALSGAAAPLGMLLAGWLLETLGTRDGQILVAMISTLFAVSLFMARPYLRMNETVPIQGDTAPAVSQRRRADSTAD